MNLINWWIISLQLDIFDVYFSPCVCACVFSCCEQIVFSTMWTLHSGQFEWQRASHCLFLGHESSKHVDCLPRWAIIKYILKRPAQKVSRMFSFYNAMLSISVHSDISAGLKTILTFSMQQHYYLYTCIISE